MPRLLLLLFGTIALATSSALASGPDPRLEGYRVAPGYQVEIAATEPLVVNPVLMTFGLDGRLFVVEWVEGRGSNDRIKTLTDTDGDGRFDKADIYMDGLDLPAGLLFWDGWTYITTGHDVVRLRDRDGDGRFEERQYLVTGFSNDNSHHRVSGLAMGPDGWLYITTGDSDARAKGSDGSEATVLRSGGVFRCRPDGTKLESVAFGMRNPFGNVAFDDEFHIFHTDNDNESTPAFTGCRLLHVVEGGDYGWRLREGARCCVPDVDRATWNGGRPGRLGSITETGRGSPAGLCVLNSAAFPPSTRNLLVYPDVFRKTVRAYKLKPSGATFAVDREFELLASGDPLFRPDDAEVGPDGALYILDWRTDSGGAGQLNGNGKTGRLYRVTWAGTDAEPARPTLPRERLLQVVRGETEGLFRALTSEDYGMRRAASLELIRRGRDLIPSQNVANDRAAWKPLLAFTSNLAHGLHDVWGRSEPRRHAMGVIAALACDRAAAGIDPGQDLDAVFEDAGLNRLAFEFRGRYARRDSESQSLVAMLDREDDPQVRRAVALDLGSFDALRRPRAGESTDSRDFRRRAKDEVDRAFGQHRANQPELRGELRQLFGRLGASMTPELIADRLIVMGGEAAKDDAFLRDGVTRGLERLGPVALDALGAAIASGDADRRRVALDTLQGWRRHDGMATILKLATRPEALPEGARLGLFRALREMVDAVPPEPIADWLTREPGDDPAARAGAVHLLAAMGKRAIPAAVRLLPPLLDEENGDVRRAALDLANVARSAEAEEALIRLAKRDDRPVEDRRKAVAALRGYEIKRMVPWLVDLAAHARDAGLTNEVLRALAPLDFGAATALARSSLDSKDRELRQEAIALLGQRPATALEVARRFNDGKLPAEDLSKVIEAARSHATPELKDAMQTLMKNHLLAAPTGGEARKLREFVQKHGDPGRGRRLFLDADKANCASCHRLEGVGNAVGPDLTRVWETLSFDKRVESILEPSKEIKEGYATTRVATTDGRVLTGLLVSETPEAVTLKDSQGREVRIPAGEVEQKGTDPVSLMPAGVVGHLSFSELADLLAFLGDRKAQEELRKP